MITINTSSYEIGQIFNELEISEGPLCASEIIEEQIIDVVSNYLGHYDGDVFEEIMMCIWEGGFDNMGELIQSLL